jgi:hypothetical protein
MQKEIDLTKEQSSEFINGYLESLREYIFAPGYFSERKDEICTITDGTATENYSLGMMIISMYFVRILVNNGIKLRIGLFFKSADSKKLGDYIDIISEEYEKYKKDLDPLKEGIIDSIVKLSDDMVKVNSLRGATINLYSIGKLAETNKEFKDLLGWEIPNGIGLNDIEKLVNEKVGRCIEILSEADTVYRDLIRGGAISTRQLGQSFVSIGLKPDVEGRVIPEPINTSFLRGLRGRQDYFTCAIGARKALLINFKQVKQSGYLARKLLLLVVNTSLDSDFEECDTKHTLPVHVEDEKTFERIVGRYEDTGHVIERSEKEKYIGKDIRIFSPITCACKTGICKRCYGKLSDKIKGFHAGIIAVLLLTEKLTQILLSSKHLLMACTEKIPWTEEFAKSFSVDKDNIFPNIGTTKIVIDMNQVCEDEEGDKYTNIISVKCENKNLVIKTPKKLFFNERDSVAMEKEATSYTMHPDSDESCFYLKTQNIELNTTLTTLIDLLQKSDHGGFGDDYRQIYNAFIEKLNKSSFKLSSVHAEMIISCLLKDKNGNKPDFSKEDPGEIRVSNIRDSILEDDSLAASLAFEQIKKQLNSIETYAKTKNGIFDELFV